LEQILYGALKHKCDKRFISWFCCSLEEVFTTIDAFDLKLLSVFNVILTPNFSRKDDLTLCRNGGSHGGKITSYQGSSLQIRLLRKLRFMTAKKSAKPHIPKEKKGQKETLVSLWK